MFIQAFCLMLMLQSGLHGNMQLTQADTMKELYFDKFMGDGPNSMIQVKTDLEKSRGDTIYFGLISRLSGGPILSGSTLEGNEEAMVDYNFSTVLEQYRFGVRDSGAINRQRAMFDIDEEHAYALKVRGQEYIDQLIMDALNASSTKIFYGGSATSTATLTATDLLTPQLIEKAATWAATGGKRAQTPIRPIKVNGGNYWVLLIHPENKYDLYQNSTFLQGIREAEVRGKENPLFAGAVLIWRNVVVHCHENIKLNDTWGSGATLHGSQCLLLGAQAGVLAWGKRPSIIQKKFDYDNEHGYAWDMIVKAGKPKFNSLDYGVAELDVIATDID